MKNEHVLKHDFGYGQEEGKIKKLRLRNLEDCKVYIEELLKATFAAKIHKNTLCFFSNGEKVVVEVESF